MAKILSNFFFENVQIDTQKTTCISILANNFHNVAALSIGVKFDTAILDFKSISNPHFNSTNFFVINTTLNLSGAITLGGSAINLINGSVLFNLCFEIKGDIIDSTSLSFVPPDFNNAATSIEIIDENANILNFTICSGKIEQVKSLPMFDVPTLSQWSILNLALSLLIIASLNLMKRKTTFSKEL
ncbi:MAG: hypothetical protein P8M34_14680 [Saprospiraceae bacterium]|nr:hypothetical protein [Saprospiraceae bacterium]